MRSWAVSEILGHTPPWVFPPFFLLLWVGLRATRPRAISLWAVGIIPALLVVLSFTSVLSVAMPRGAALAIWVGMVVSGAAGGYRLWRRAHISAVERRRLQVPGTWITLLLIVSVFATRYYFGYLFARYPELGASPPHMIMLLAITSLATGFMLGGTSRHVEVYWTALKGRG